MTPEMIKAITEAAFGIAGCFTLGAFSVLILVFAYKLLTEKD